MASPVAELADSLQAGYNAALWTYNGDTTWSGAGMTVTSPASTEEYGGIDSAQNWSLAGSAVYAQLVSGGNQALASWQVFISCAAGSGGVQWQLQGGELAAQSSTGSGYSNVATIAYSAAAMQWLRIREASGTVYWDYSADGHAWVTLTSAADPVSLASVQVQIGAGTYDSEASATAATWANVNTPAPVIVNTWTDSYTWEAVSYFPYPTASALAVPVDGANTAGNWLVAVIAWRQPAAGDEVSFSVADDAHNWWEPLCPDSPAAGTLRTSVWVAPAARACGYVAVSATSQYAAAAVVIAEVSGTGPGWTVTPYGSGYANAATTLTANAAAPAAASVLLAGWASDLSTATITPPSGWTAIGSVTAANGTDHNGDLELACGWQSGSAATSATVTSSTAVDLAAVIAGFEITGAVPEQGSAYWPAVVTELAIGSGPQSVPAAMEWTPVTSRDLSVSMQQGRQYTLAQLQAGQGTLTLDNPDGALIPPGSGAYAGIESGVPVRQRCYWPGLPGGTANPTPWYIPVGAYVQRWPFNAPDAMMRGQAQASLADIFAYGSGVLNSMAKEECLLDAPYALWPLDDAAGSTGGSNLAPGNSSQLQLVTQKLGAGGSAVTWGANSGALLGNSSAKVTVSGTNEGASGMFQQDLSGAAPSTGSAPVAVYDNGYGYALACTDENYPPVAGGVTIECEFQCTGYYDNVVEIYGVSVAASSAVFASDGETFPVATPVVLSVISGNALPGGFTAGTVYYVTANSATFGLSATPGGTAITATTAGEAFLTALATASNVVVWSAQDVRGPVVELSIQIATGHLFLSYTTAAGVQAVTIDTHDWRQIPLTFASVAFNATGYRVWIPVASSTAITGTWSAAISPKFTYLCFGGVVTPRQQGWAMPGYLAFAAVYPGMLQSIRALSHLVAATGFQEEENAFRTERLLEYAGLTGRRMIQVQMIAGEGDLAVSGQDIGGQAAASSLNNIAASAVPGLLYVAPNGDMVRADKWFLWNQDIRWTLGDDTAAGEIPFALPGMSTDYDPSRVVNDIQLTQLDTQTTTLPSGTTSGTTMAAVEAASEEQFGDQPLQQTGYQANDFTSAYSAGSSMVDLANWIANVYSRPANRVQQVTVDAAQHPAAWPFYLGASVGDMVQVNVRLPTAATSPLISLVARVTQTSRNMKFSGSGTAATIGCVLDFAPEYQALMCDDAVRGLLDGTNVLSW